LVEGTKIGGSNFGGGSALGDLGGSLGGGGVAGGV